MYIFCFFWLYCLHFSFIYRAPSIITLLHPSDPTVLSGVSATCSIWTWLVASLPLEWLSRSYQSSKSSRKQSKAGLSPPNLRSPELQPVGHVIWAYYLCFSLSFFFSVKASNTYLSQQGLDPTRSGNPIMIYIFDLCRSRLYFGMRPGFAHGPPVIFLLP